MTPSPQTRRLREMNSAASNEFVRLLEIVDRLRAPDGCPWDRKQTPSSMRKHLLEETYETIEAISNSDAGHVREELGDVLMLVALIAKMYAESDDFSMADVLTEVNEKLVRRHPHVFGEVTVSDEHEVVRQWNAIKRDQEGKTSGPSALSGVSGGVPPLERANELQRKAAKVGFDWPEIDGVFEKIHEELDEVREELSAGGNDAAHDSGARSGTGSSHRLEDEIGDVLFSAVNLSRFMGIDPSIALHRANAKFISRFELMESLITADSGEIGAMDIEAMDAYWNRAKEQERTAD